MEVVTAMGAEEVEAVITTEVAETLLPGTAVAPRWDVAAPGTMEVQTVTVVVATGVVAQVDTKRLLYVIDGENIQVEVIDMSLYVAMITVPFDDDNLLREGT
nr:unnamed protein product [Timema bartmani]